MSTYRTRLRAGQIVAIAVVMCGCSPHRTAAHDDNPGAPDKFATLYDIRGEVSPMDETVALPTALDLPSLRKQSLPSGEREIRVYTGLVIGYPRNVLIVRQSGGLHGNVTGRLARYWPTNDSAFYPEMGLEKHYADLEAHHCERPRRGAQAVACYVRLRHEPDWRGLLVQLDSINAWTLPDESRVPHRGMVIDGWVLRVEARRDTSYNRYQYHNPEIYRPPEGEEASRLLVMVDSLFRFAR